MGELWPRQLPRMPTATNDRASGFPVNTKGRSRSDPRLQPRPHRLPAALARPGIVTRARLNSGRTWPQSPPRPPTSSFRPSPRCPFPCFPGVALSAWASPAPSCWRRSWCPAGSASTRRPSPCPRWSSSTATAIPLRCGSPPSGALRATAGRGSGCTRWTCPSRWRATTIGWSSPDAPRRTTWLGTSGPRWRASRGRTGAARSFWWGTPGVASQSAITSPATAARPWSRRRSSAGPRTTASGPTRRSGRAASSTAPGPS